MKHFLLLVLLIIICINYTQCSINRMNPETLIRTKHPDLDDFKSDETAYSPGKFFWDIEDLNKIKLQINFIINCIENSNNESSFYLLLNFQEGMNISEIYQNIQTIFYTCQNKLNHH